MPLKVIGSGFGRTGTNSLQLALQDLGFDKCYHMYEIFPEPERSVDWLDAALGKPVDWEKVFDGYQSAVDWPATFFWETFLNLYPDAKVVHTERPAEKWYDSISNTIFALMKEGMKAGVVEGATVPNVQQEMVIEIVIKQTFGGNIEDKDHILDIYEKHNAKVKATVPPERLLVFDVVEGWEPLCKFLEVPVPSGDFPRTNARDEFASPEKRGVKE